MGLVDAEVSGGYSSTPGNGSGALDDRTSYRFSLCEFCLDWLFSQFKIPPTVKDMDGDSIGPWKPAAQRVTEDVWRIKRQEFFIDQRRRELARWRGPILQVLCRDEKAELVLKPNALVLTHPDLGLKALLRLRDSLETRLPEGVKVEAVQVREGVEDSNY
jgi:hypothetical protein